MSLFEHLRRRRRPLRAVQVEVTSRCTRRCAICPRSALSKTWLEGDMDLVVRENPVRRPRSTDLSLRSGSTRGSNKRRLFQESLWSPAIEHSSPRETWY
jgi:hypothetical protein